MSLSLHESAVRVGALCWWERRVFEVLGASSAPGTSRVGEGSAAVDVLVDRHAAHAAWRAAQWWDRLPVLAVVDRGALLRPPARPGPGVGIEVVFDALATGEWPDAGRLAGIYRVVLPRLSSTYLDLGVDAGPVADGPLLRTLAQVETDLETDRRQGERLLQGLLVTGEAVEQAAAALVRLEGLLVSGG